MVTIGNSCFWLVQQVSDTGTAHCASSLHMTLIFVHNS